MKAYTVERTESISIGRFRDLLGADVVLLPCVGKRPLVAGWQKLTADTMHNPDYIAKLESAPNIGVLLGERSGGLCVVDFDADGEDEKFLALNPALAGTLRTRGRRGSSFWLRVIGDIPPSAKLKRHGEDLGEWRANGNQSIVAGLHPETGEPYRMLHEARPVQIAFADIVWPACFDTAKTRINAARNAKLFNHVTDDVHVTDDSEDFEVVKCLSSWRDLSAASEDEIVALCVPNKPRENNARLFELARGVRTLEREHGQELSERDLKRVFGKWHRRARPCLRVGQTRAQYWEEFLRACDVAQLPLDEGGLLTAWQRAKKSEPPECAAVFRSSAGRMLVSLCWQLQRLTGDGDFFLSCLNAAKLLNVTPVHTASLLRALVAKGILKMVEKGFTGRATRYRFSDKSNPKGIIV